MGTTRTATNPITLIFLSFPDQREDSWRSIGLNMDLSTTYGHMNGKSMEPAFYTSLKIKKDLLYPQHKFSKNISCKLSTKSKN